MLQRVATKTASLAYSYLYRLCNHSFEGVTGSARNQQAFLSRNIKLLAAAGRASVDSVEELTESTAIRFNSKGDTLPLLNQYQISQGSLPRVTSYLDKIDNLACSIDVVLPNVASLPATEVSWSKFASYLGLNLGDQLTFVVCPVKVHQTGINISATEFNPDAMILQRIVFSGADGLDGVALSAGSNSVTQRLTNLNPSTDISAVSEIMSTGNILNVAFDNVPGLTASQDASEVDEDVTIIGACGVIASRYENGQWRRSTDFLKVFGVDTVGTDYYDSGLRLITPSSVTLGVAIRSYMSQVTSSLYLNQATD